MALQLDGRAFAPSNVPHDDGVVGASREQHPLRRVPAQRGDVTLTQTHGLKRSRLGAAHAASLACRARSR